MNALDTLLSRASSSRLGLPVPDRATIGTILAAAVRAPDHGRLAPWRFLVVEGEGLARLADAGEASLLRREPAATAPDIGRAREKLTRAPMVIVLGAHLRTSHKIPVFEQHLAVAAGAMNVLNALHAAGFSGKWVTGAHCEDPGFVEALGFEAGEQILGMILAGTPETAEPPARPDAAALTRFWS